MSIETALNLDPDTQAALDRTVRAWEPIWADADHPELVVAAGWLPTVARLGAALQRINPDLQVELVREESAELRVYYRAPRDRAADMIVDMYTVVLQRTCDQCGRPGHRGVSNGWYSTRCPDHTPDHWEPAPR